MVYIYIELLLTRKKIYKYVYTSQALLFMCRYEYIYIHTHMYSYIAAFLQFISSSLFLIYFTQQVLQPTVSMIVYSLANLQHIATHCHIILCTQCCSVLQFNWPIWKPKVSTIVCWLSQSAIHCNTLTHTTLHTVLQCVADKLANLEAKRQHNCLLTKPICNTLQHTATHCHILLYTLWCSVLQCVAVCCRVTSQCKSRKLQCEE